MSQSDNQSATQVGLLHGLDTEDGNLSEVWSVANELSSVVLASMQRFDN